MIIANKIISREQLAIDVIVEFQRKTNACYLHSFFLLSMYDLCLILVGMSIFFIIALGIEFGDMKSQQWYNNDQPNKYLDGFINDKSNRTYVRMEN